MEVDDSIPNAATVCDMQEVKHGEWIYVDGDVGYNVYRCSKCGEVISLDEEKYIITALIVALKWAEKGKMRNDRKTI